MNWKIQFRELTGWRLKNDEEWWRTMKNDEEWWTYGSVTEAPRLGFSSRKHIFSPKTAEMHRQGVRNLLKQPPSPIYRKNGRCLPPRRFLRKICKRTPITKFTPLFVLYGKVTKALQKCFGFDFHLFFSSLSPTWRSDVPSFSSIF